MTAEEENYYESFVSTYCDNCEKAQKEKSTLIHDCESVFDAVFDYRMFLKECSKTCKKLLDKNKFL